MSGGVTRMVVLVTDVLYITYVIRVRASYCMKRISLLYLTDLKNPAERAVPLERLASSES